MTTINLKDFYSWHTHDEYLGTPMMNISKFPMKWPPSCGPTSCMRLPTSGG